MAVTYMLQKSNREEQEDFDIRLMPIMTKSKTIQIISIIVYFFRMSMSYFNDCIHDSF